ncbi:glycoside hydrolase family 43 protein [Streptomyces sp. SB3404]|uniref:Glycoside hydrolase family 43 protein n=1 Tax=Streptomyces boncukensis TaxID=2711219 RepID=A0A6G4X0P2_9ACTN|nr:glycoside hydrolase family 43 protein [Streptomyces boncukensis]
MRATALLASAVLLLGAAAAGPAGGASDTGSGSRQEAYAGYLFTYFTGEGSADGEQIRLALSDGNDPLRYRELNGGAPVLTSDVGERGVRDPYVIRAPGGDTFYLIATDLRMYGNGDWDQAQRTGSKSLVVWESTDLVHWSDARLARVAPDTAGNTWAPEAYYDEDRGTFVVFWASKLYAEDDPDHTGTTYNRMMYATTDDFRTFSGAGVWNDPGYSVIDSTLAKDGDTYYRFTKDERGTGPDAPCGKFITEEKSADILDPDYTHVADCIGQGAVDRGEGPAVFKSNTEDKWYLLVDEFGGRGYVPFETTDLGSGNWTPSSGYALPAHPRHGSVLPVTREEYNRLAGRFGVRR